MLTLEIAQKHQINHLELQKFLEDIAWRKIFDGERFSDLLMPLNLGWKERAAREDLLLTDLMPILDRFGGAIQISGLKPYLCVNQQPILAILELP